MNEPPTLDEIRFLRQQFLATCDGSLLARALELCHAVVDAVSDRGLAHLEMASLLALRYQQLSELSDLDTTLYHLDRATELIPADDINAPAVYTNIVGVRTQRYLRLDDDAELQAGIAMAETALRRLPADHVRDSSLRNNLAGLLRVRFQRHGDLPDLDGSIDQARTALEESASANPLTCATLAGSLLLRFRHSGAAQDLAEAVTLARTGAVNAPIGHRDRMSVLAIAAGAFRLHFEHTGTVASLTAAENYQREILSYLDERNAEAGIILLDLAYTYRLRYERLGSRHDIDALTASVARAVCSPDPQIRVAATGCHAQALQAQVDWLERAGDTAGALATAHAAVAKAEEAVAATGLGHPHRPDLLLILANSRAAVYRHTRDPAVAADAESHLAAALQALAPKDPRAACLTIALAGHLVTIAAETAAPDQLSTAVRLAQATLVSVPRHSPVWEAAIRTLVAALVLVGMAGERDVNAEIVTLVEQLDAARTVAAAKLVATAVLAGDELLRAGHAGAARTYAIAVAALPAAAWHGLDRVSQEAHLRDVNSVASAGAAAQLRYGDATTALEHLDGGRNVLWSHLLNARGSVDALSRYQPTLAARLTEVSAALYG